MKDAFGVGRISKVKLPTKVVRRMADGQKRSKARVDALESKISQSGRIDPLAVNIYRGKPYLMNGHHRLEVAERKGLKFVPVKIRFGSYKAWKDQSVSKIAMQPVYHGTTPAGANKLRRFIKAKDSSKSAWKPLEGFSRDGSFTPRKLGPYELPTPRERQGLFTTPSLNHAKQYSLYGRGPAQGGERARRSRGKVMVFNAVGVKPKSRGQDLGGREAVYDPKDLGMPVATISTRRH